MKTRQLFIFGLGLLITSVCGQEKKLKCNPVNDLENFSSQDASAVIYDVTEEKVNTAKNVSILCYSKSKPEIRFITELMVFGEPPKTVDLDLNIAVLSDLYNTTLHCPMHDIESLNRRPFPEEKDFYKKMSGSVTYKCDSEQLQLELGGTELLKKDFRVPGVSAEQSPNKPFALAQAQKNEDIQKLCETCVKNGAKPPGSNRDNLGYLCSCSSGGIGRVMYHEKEEPGCFACCANHYFSTLSYSCEECGGCYANQTLNLRTSCMPCTSDESSTISTISSSTTSTTTLTSTPSTIAGNDESGLTPGEIAGVVVGSIAIVLLIVGIYCCVKNRERFPGFNQPPIQPTYTLGTGDTTTTTV